MSERNLGKVKLEPMLSVDWFTATMCRGLILGILFSEHHRIQKNLRNPDFIIPRYNTTIQKLSLGMIIVRIALCVWENGGSKIQVIDQVRSQVRLQVRSGCRSGCRSGQVNRKNIFWPRKLTIFLGGKQVIYSWDMLQ